MLASSDLFFRNVYEITEEVLALVTTGHLPSNVTAVAVTWNLVFHVSWIRFPPKQLAARTLEHHYSFRWGEICVYFSGKSEIY